MVKIDKIVYTTLLMLLASVIGILIGIYGITSQIFYWGFVGSLASFFFSLIIYNLFKEANKIYYKSYHMQDFFNGLMCGFCTLLLYVDIKFKMISFYWWYLVLLLGSVLIFIWCYIREKKGQKEGENRPKMIANRK